MTDCARRREADRLVARLDGRQIQRLLYDWEVWARDDQLPPIGDWTTWLMLGGRGAGKTRAGAEWVRGVALGHAPFAAKAAGRIALIGETHGDVRDVMIEGESGLLAIHPRGERPDWQPSRRRLEWPNGSLAQTYSSEDPQGLRGPQFAAAWADELCKWRHRRETWDMLQLALRLGDRPRQVVTTTPRPVPVLRELLKDEKTVTSHATTEMNARNLASTFLTAIVGRYAGTRLGRQELDGEVIDDRPDALWNRARIDALRLAAHPALERIVVAVDPPVSASESADACGIVAAGLGADGEAYVLEDATVAAVGPGLWAERAVAVFKRWGADRLVVEVNQGGNLVEAVIRKVDPSIPIRPVRATRGKWLRAEPVAALYEQGRVHHVGCLAELEDELCDFGHDGLSAGHSPDRLDALVWALTALMLDHRGRPRLHTL